MTSLNIKAASAKTMSFLLMWMCHLFMFTAMNCVETEQADIEFCENSLFVYIFPCEHRLKLGFPMSVWRCVWLLSEESTTEWLSGSLWGTWKPPKTPTLSSRWMQKGKWSNHGGIHLGNPWERKENVQNPQEPLSVCSPCKIFNSVQAHPVTVFTLAFWMSMTIF